MGDKASAASLELTFPKTEVLLLVRERLIVMHLHAAWTTVFHAAKIFWMSRSCISSGSAILAHPKSRLLSS